MEKHIIESNTTSDNLSSFIDNKNYLCQHKKLHPLTARKRKWISKIIYRDIENLFNSTYLDTSLQTKMNVYQLRR